MALLRTGRHSVVLHCLGHIKLTRESFLFVLSLFLSITPSMVLSAISPAAGTLRIRTLPGTVESGWSRRQWINAGHALGEFPQNPAYLLVLGRWCGFLHTFPLICIYPFEMQYRSLQRIPRVFSGISRSQFPYCGEKLLQSLSRSFRSRQRFCFRHR